MAQKKERGNKKRCEICNAYLREGNKLGICESHTWHREKRGNDLPSSDKSGTIVVPFPFH
jgi:hypothetical protein